ncbi:hypothetical protein HELRODRAFT_192917 [Helobdella robusta]|uniref:Tubulin polyglutamylase complex subunit 1-like C-terminal domain-containing protein n=1 Tax=Helobdella robusta TaxID=6412 RepID=T1FUF4_HELRO|nr:hypothetical protein HELRODRAFT_192917 [Helobdella robusta]ESN98432.1 hypothetical protein HELRODRAFT_192917 [Helobdella robusta]
MNKLVFLIITSSSILLQYGSFTSAISCYQCDVDTPNCGEPFVSNGAGVTTCQGAYCVSSVSVSAKGSTGLRTCSNGYEKALGCIETQHGDIKIMGCVCDTNFCNGYEYSQGSNAGKLSCYSCVADQCKLPDVQKPACSGTTCFHTSSTLSSQAEVFGCSDQKYATTCVNDDPTTKTCYCSADWCNTDSYTLATSSTTTTTTKSPVKPLVTCFECGGLNCQGSAITIPQCIGTSCVEVNSVHDQGSSLTQRSCSHDVLPTMCRIVEFKGSYATYCSCSSNYCNFNFKIGPYLMLSNSSVKCYQCLGVQCSQPVSNLTTCQGTTCVQVKSSDPLLRIGTCTDLLVVSGCLPTTDPSITTQSCYCRRDYCNMSPAVVTKDLPMLIRKSVQHCCTEIEGSTEKIAQPKNYQTRFRIISLTQLLLMTKLEEKTGVSRTLEMLMRELESVQPEDPIFYACHFFESYIDGSNSNINYIINSSTASNNNNNNTNIDINSSSNHTSCNNKSNNDASRIAESIRIMKYAKYHDSYDFERAICRVFDILAGNKESNQLNCINGKLLDEFMKSLTKSLLDKVLEDKLAKKIKFRHGDAVTLAQFKQALNLCFSLQEIAKTARKMFLEVLSGYNNNNNNNNTIHNKNNNTDNNSNNNISSSSSSSSTASCSKPSTTTTPMMADARLSNVVVQRLEEALKIAQQKNSPSGNSLSCSVRNKDFAPNENYLNNILESLRYLSAEQMGAALHKAYLKSVNNSGRMSCGEFVDKIVGVFFEFQIYPEMMKAMLLISFFGAMLVVECYHYGR